MKKKKDGSRGRKRWLVALAAVLLLFCTGLWSGDRFLKQRDHPGLRTFIGQWMRNYPASFAVEPLTLSIQVKERDLEQLVDVVENAREIGVIMPEGNEYVDAEVGDGSGSFKAKLRIKGKLTDHVKGSKWSFRVVAKKDGGFLGMKRFSLQHPGTRNYLCDWFYHRLMDREGVIALRYGFIRLSFNDEDLGIYAYEEHFGPELLEHTGRLAGPLFRFDPALFWEHRLNEMNKLRFNEPFAAYQAAAVDAFGSSDLLKDDRLRAQFEEAVALIDGFRRGELSASRVFDADRIAKRHAILDLIGGHHSMDWSDVKFYYDPLAKRIEPVSYESFSAFPLRTLAGSDRWTGKHESGQDLHDQYFNDEQVFRAYVKHLERVSRKNWLDSTFTAIKPALDSASATLYREFPYKELDRSIYYKNQLVIRKLLNGPKPFHAYFDAIRKDTLRVTIVPIEGLPMEVHALLLPDGTRVEPVGQRIVPCRRPGKLGEPFELRFVVTGDVDRKGMMLACSVLGASHQREVEVFPYALLDGEAIARPKPVDPRTLGFFVFDEAARTIAIKPGSWSVTADVELPPGYVVNAVAPMTLDIARGVRLLSRSPVKWTGMEESPITVSNNGEFMLLETGGRSSMDRVIVVGEGRIIIQQAPMRIERSAFHTFGSVDNCTIVRSAVEMRECIFAGGRDGLTLIASNVKAEQCEVRGAMDDGLVVRGGSVVWKDGGLESGTGAGLKLGVQGEAVLEGMTIRSNADGIELREGSVLKMTKGSIRSKERGIVVKDMERLSGASSVELVGVTIEAAGTEVDAGKGNEVLRDGKQVGVAEEQTGKQEKKGKMKPDGDDQVH